MVEHFKLFLKINYFLKIIHQKLSYFIFDKNVKISILCLYKLFSYEI